MYSKQQGFSLIEIIVVIAMLAILLSIVIFSGDDARSTAKLTVAEQDVQQIMLALQLYKETNGALPANLTDLSDYLSKDVSEDSWGNAFAYNNNYDTGTSGLGSSICSNGPDGNPDTGDSELAVYEAGGDDICRFIFDND